jgi:hypothetical protein
MSDVYVKSRTPKEDGTLVADLHECMRHSTPEGRVWAQTVLNLLRDLEAGGERQKAARWRLDDIRITLVVGAVEKEGRMSAERDRQDRLYKQLREAEAERSTRKLLIVMVPIVSRLLWSEVKLFGLKVEHLLLSGYWWRRNRG